jgi:predicted TIM-barrel fold metal-dependent hydrolase
MIIDAHAHIGRFNSWPLASGHPTHLVEMLRRDAVDHALVSSARALYYDCPEGNAEVLAAAAAHREIIPLLCVNPRRPEEAMQQLDGCSERGFVGVKLHPTSHEYSLTSPQAQAVFGACEESGIPVLTHSSEDDPRCDSEAIRAVAQRYPSLTLVVGHACLFGSRDMVSVAELHPSLLLEISVNYEAGKLEDTIQRVGHERVLFGSDAPLHHPGVMLKRIEMIGLAQRELDAILGENTCRVFRLNV